MMSDFLCCAHETVPPTLSPSPIIYICSSFSAVILQLFPYFFSLLPLPIWGRKKILQTLLICSHTPSPLSSAELLVLHFQEMLLWNAAETASTVLGENFWATAGNSRGNSLWFALCKPLFCISWGPQFAFFCSRSACPSRLPSTTWQRGDKGPCSVW